MMAKRVLAETVNDEALGGGVKASAEVVERMRSSEAVARVASTALEGQGNHCSTRGVRSKEVAGQEQV